MGAGASGGANATGGLAGRDATGGAAGPGGRGGSAGGGGRNGAAGLAGRGATGGSGPGGAIGTGGHGGAAGATGVSGTGGAAGATFTCKRGIAANTAPGAAFYRAVRWWYNWSLTPSGDATGIEFVPMVWGSSTVNGAIPAGARYLLGFNEPNFMSQSNLTPQAAAAAWPTLQANGRTAGVSAIIGPGLNFCGPAASCNGTDPYVYLTDFLNACAGCEVDHIAAHWYNCDLPSLRAYIESNSSLAGWVQFGKPIWLTEFSCDDSATEAQQETFMRAAVPYLEAQPNVFRYSWFSADPIPNGKLVNSDGSPTPLGQIYISLPANCP
jgi:Glycosyl hydrolase catalytic core